MHVVPQNRIDGKEKRLQGKIYMFYFLAQRSTLITNANHCYFSHFQPKGNRKVKKYMVGTEMHLFTFLATSLPLT